MKREIKFRAFDEKNGMVYNPAYRLSSVGEIDLNSLLSVTPNLMQFTGLLDKNGKEIYEGDIMYFPENEQNIWEMQDIKKPVIFERGAFRVDVYEGFKKVIDDETAIEGEVIGNIYENPELLK